MRCSMLVALWLPNGCAPVALPVLMRNARPVLERNVSKYEYRFFAKQTYFLQPPLQKKYNYDMMKTTFKTLKMREHCGGAV